MRKFLSRKFFFMLIVAALIGAGLSAIYDKILENQAKDYVVSSLNKLKQKKRIKALSSISSNKLKDLGKLNSYKITKTDVSMNFTKTKGIIRTAKVNAKARFTEARAILKFHLKRYNGKWKVTALNITSIKKNK